MKIKFYKTNLLGLVLLTAVQSLQAQIANFDEEKIQQEFVYNINIYSSAYISPVIDAYGLNQTVGWQTSGKTLKPFAFSIGAHGASTFVPDANTSFNFNALPFTDNFTLENPNDPNLPTALGGSTGQRIIYETEGQTILGPTSYMESFPAFDGTTTPFNAVPNMGLIAAVGLPMDFEVLLKVFPPIDILGVDIRQFGGGVKHTLSRYFLDEDNPFHLGIGAFYSTSRFIFEPTDFYEGEGQEIIFKDNTLNLESVLSYDLKYFSAFALLGYYNNQSNFQLNGTYNYEVDEGVLVQEAFSVKDPVNLEANNSNMRVGVGAALKLSTFAELAAAYQFAEYNTLSVNLTFKFLNGED